MPFRYDVPLPPLPGVETSDGVRLIRWLAGERARVEAGGAIPVVARAGATFEVAVTGRAFVLERLAREGEALAAESAIAVVAADGEDIPYGRPYSVARKL